MQNEQTTSKNSSPRTTADIVNSIKYELANLSPSKQAFTFLLLWTVGIVYLGLTGCRQDYPTKISSSESSTAETASSNESSAPTSSDTRTAYTYMAQGQVKPVDPASVPTVVGSLKLDPERTITISGVINNSVFNTANELVGLANESNKPIDIVISSPGGSVAHGLMFIQIMKDVKAKGVKLRCVVPTLAASMAFTILTQCDERYTLPYAQLLFHSPRIMGTFVISSQASRRLAAGLTELERVLLHLIIPAMGVDKDSQEWFEGNYDEETLFTGYRLALESPTHWLTVVAQVKGYKGSWPAPYPSKEVSESDRRGVTPPNVDEGAR